MNYCYSLAFNNHYKSLLSLHELLQDDISAGGFMLSCLHGFLFSLFLVILLN